MTLSEFDPMCFGQYPEGKEPPVLHFQYESNTGAEPDICRYVLVERIKMADIDNATRRKAGEPIDGEELRQMYLKPKPEPKVEPEPAAKKKTANKRSK